MTGADDDRTHDAEPERPVPPAGPVPPVPPAAGEDASSAAAAPQGARAAVPPVPPAPGSSAPAWSDMPPPAYSAPATPQRTATIAVVALVLAFVAPVVGLVLGIVSLGRVRRTGEEGRGLAIGAIVVGSVMSALILILTLVLVVVTIAGLGAASAVGPGAGSDPGATALPPSEDDPTEPVPDSDDTDVFALNIGDCLLEAGLTAEQVESVPLVDCAVAHDYEVYAEPLLGGDVHPGQDALDEQADALCFDAFEPYVGAPYESSALDFSYLSPTEGSWDAGDREVSCLLYDPAGLLTGSVRGSAR